VRKCFPHFLGFVAQSVSTHSSNADIRRKRIIYRILYTRFIYNYLHNGAHTRSIPWLSTGRVSASERTTSTRLCFETGEPPTHQLRTQNSKTRVREREYRATNYIINVITQGPYPALAKHARHLLAYQLWGNLGSPGRPLLPTTTPRLKTKFTQ
jgi:hypothetical protein